MSIPFIVAILFFLLHKLESWIIGIISPAAWIFLLWVIIIYIYRSRWKLMTTSGHRHKREWGSLLRIGARGSSYPHG
jgi:hypothetical protein